MLDHVVERFLRDPIERDLHRRRQASAELAAHPDGHPGTPAHVLGKKLQRGHEPEPIEHHRPQLVGDVAQLRLDLAQEPLHPVETLAVVRRQLVRDVGDCDVHRGEKLSGLVVQRVGDLLRFVFQRFGQLPPYACAAHGLLLLANDALSLLHETDGYGVGDPVRRRLVSVQDPVEQFEVRSIFGEERAREYVAQQQHNAHHLVGLYPARDDAPGEVARVGLQCLERSRLQRIHVVVVHGGHLGEDLLVGHRVQQFRRDDPAGPLLAQLGAVLAQVGDQPAQQHSARVGTRLERTRRFRVNVCHGCLLREKRGRYILNLDP